MGRPGSAGCSSCWAKSAAWPWPWPGAQAYGRWTVPSSCPRGREEPGPIATSASAPRDGGRLTNEVDRQRQVPLVVREARGVERPLDLEHHVAADRALCRDLPRPLEIRRGIGGLASHVDRLERVRTTCDGERTALPREVRAGPVR